MFASRRWQQITARRCTCRNAGWAVGLALLVGVGRVVLNSSNVEQELPVMLLRRACTRIPVCLSSLLFSPLPPHWLRARPASAARSWRGARSRRRARVLLATNRNCCDGGVVAFVRPDGSTRCKTQSAAPRHSADLLPRAASAAAPPAPANQTLCTSGCLQKPRGTPHKAFIVTLTPGSKNEPTIIRHPSIKHHPH